MKIIHIISNLGNGGAEKLVVELANEQSKIHDVTIITFRDIEDWMIFPKLIDKKIELIQLGKRKGFELNLYRKLFRVFRQLQPDIINFHLHSTIKYIAPFIFIFNHCKFVYTIHSNLGLTKKGYLKISNLLLGSKKNIKYVCISPIIFTEFSAVFRNLKFQQISNGVVALKKTKKFDAVLDEIEMYKNDNETIVAVSVGGIFHMKNYPLLAQAFKQLKHKNIISFVIGDLSIADPIQLDEICALKSKNVHFIGLKSNVGDYMNASDVFVMSSYNEGMPIAALEALSIGLPIVSTPAGGMVDIVEDGINGFISDDFTLDNFIKQILSFLELDAKGRQEMKDRNIEKHRRMYSIEQCSRNYIDLYLKQ